MSIRVTVLVILIATVTASTWAGGISGKINGPAIADYSNVIIYAEKNPKESVPALDTPAVIDQVNMTFVPHVLTVLVGTTVSFPNSESVQHNVYSTSRAKRFNLGTYPRGITKVVVFDKPGEVEVLCNVHADMLAYVLVLETPHFTVAAKDGNYSLKGLPPGNYTVTVWQERFKSVSQPVEIKGTATVSLNLELSQRR